jgi:hypothetical protein
MKQRIVYSALLTCPNCYRQFQVAMPTNACVVLWQCPQCEVELRPKAGDCCVFCSYSDTPCPIIQAMGAEN